MKLVDGEKLFKEMEELICYRNRNQGTKEETVRWDRVIERIKSCTLSPAELEGGATWVLEELKKFLEGKLDMHLVGIRGMIKDLESQAPASGLVAKIRENEEKARAWEKLEEDIKTWGVVPSINKWELKRKMDELLAQEE